MKHTEVYVGKDLDNFIQHAKFIDKIRTKSGKWRYIYEKAKTKIMPGRKPELVKPQHKVATKKIVSTPNVPTKTKKVVATSSRNIALNTRRAANKRSNDRYSKSKLDERSNNIKAKRLERAKSDMSAANARKDQALQKRRSDTKQSIKNVESKKTNPTMSLNRTGDLAKNLNSSLKNQKSC